MAQSITITAETFKAYVQNLKHAVCLPVSVSSFVTGGIWEDASGEPAFVYGSRLPIVKTGRASVTVLVDGEPFLLVPVAPECRYAVVLTETV